MDLIYKGQASGNVATALLNNGFNLNALRSWVGDDSKSYMTEMRGGKPDVVLAQNNATLRKDEWIELDRVVIGAARERLRLVADLRAAGLTYNLPNGMGRTVLESQTMGDITPAIISMDPTRQSEGDRPEFDLVGLPLPIIHKDFKFNIRQIATSRNGGTPIDTTTAALAGRRVAEMAEQLALGTAGTISYGGGTVYGITNFPQRITSSLTDPTDSGWTPSVLVNEVLAMRQLSVNKFHYGPWVMYNSPGWDSYLDADYSELKGDITLRERLQKINGVQDIRTLDHLTGLQILLVQQTTDVIREVIGMDITTVQWESLGGLELNFKVMAILVPQIRADQNGNTGLVHGSVA